MNWHHFGTMPLIWIDFNPSLTGEHLEMPRVATGWQVGVRNITAHPNGTRTTLFCHNRNQPQNIHSTEDVKTCLKETYTEGSVTGQWVVVWVVVWRI